MKKAIFVSGFDNWGKSTIIRSLFHPHLQFRMGIPYSISGVNARFTVEQASNDDYWGERWLLKIRDRLVTEREADLNLFSALCPTVHPDNNFVSLLNDDQFDRYDELYLFLLEYKWEHHAKLILNNIVSASSRLQRVNFITIDADRNETSEEFRKDAKVAQIRKELQKIFS